MTIKSHREFTQPKERPLARQEAIVRGTEVSRFLWRPKLRSPPLVEVREAGKILGAGVTPEVRKRAILLTRKKVPSSRRFWGREYEFSEAKSRNGGSWEKASEEKTWAHKKGIPQALQLCEKVEVRGCPDGLFWERSKRSRMGGGKQASSPTPSRMQ